MNHTLIQIDTKIHMSTLTFCDCTRKSKSRKSKLNLRDPKINYYTMAGRCYAFLERMAHTPSHDNVWTSSSICNVWKPILHDSIVSSTTPPSSFTRFIFSIDFTKDIKSVFWVIHKLRRQVRGRGIHLMPMFVNMGE